MAPLRVVSLYSLYMLWYPVRDWYRTHTPKFFTVVGFFSKIWTYRERSASKPAAHQPPSCQVLGQA